MSFTETFVKPLVLSIISLFLGSLIFVGVIENYKDDSNLKVKLLEDYFKPSRELTSSCLKRQNDLYLQYPMYSSSLRLFSEEMTHLLNNPSLNSNPDYELALKAVAETHMKSGEKLKALEKEVKKCKVEVFQSLEVLSLATGTFNEFTELSKNRAESLKSIYKTRSNERKANTSGISVTELQSMMRSIFTIDFSSKKGQQELQQKMKRMLPVIEKNSEIMSKTEMQLYKAESKFYSDVRQETSKQISNKFKDGFLTWLF
ncbi:MAG: hypothetical protein CMF18_08395 [Idiomarinaceae bacterium]|nr:hypothetical protein [Idiomarinaceae bacterium]|tara:strand:- start:1485 stop:2261 length:777 start_codon:yes stop_codon:yes gene_type:complete